MVGKIFITSNQLSFDGNYGGIELTASDKICSEVENVLLNNSGIDKSIVDCKNAVLGKVSTLTSQEDGSLDITVKQGVTTGEVETLIKNLINGIERHNPAPAAASESKAAADLVAEEVALKAIDAAALAAGKVGEAAGGVETMVSRLTDEAVDPAQAAAKEEDSAATAAPAADALAAAEGEAKGEGKEDPSAVTPPDAATAALAAAGAAEGRAAAGEGKEDPAAGVGAGTDNNSPLLLRDATKGELSQMGKKRLEAEYLRHISHDSQDIAYIQRPISSQVSVGSNPLTGASAAGGGGVVAGGAAAAGGAGGADPVEEAVDPAQAAAAKEVVFEAKGAALADPAEPVGLTQQEFENFIDGVKDAGLWEEYKQMGMDDLAVSRAVKGTLIQSKRGGDPEYFDAASDKKVARNKKSPYYLCAAEVGLFKKMLDKNKEEEWVNNDSRYSGADVIDKIEAICDSAADKKLTSLLLQDIYSSRYTCGFMLDISPREVRLLRDMKPGKSGSYYEIDLFSSSRRVVSAWRACIDDMKGTDGDITLYARKKGTFTIDKNSLFKNSSRYEQAISWATQNGVKFQFYGGKNNNATKNEQAAMDHNNSMVNGVDRLLKDLKGKDKATDTEPNRTLLISIAHRAKLLTIFEAANTKDNPQLNAELDSERAKLTAVIFENEGIIPSLEELTKNFDTDKYVGNSDDSVDKQRMMAAVIASSPESFKWASLAEGLGIRGRSNHKMLSRVVGGLKSDKWSKMRVSNSDDKGWLSKEFVTKIVGKIAGFGTFVSRSWGITGPSKPTGSMANRSPFKLGVDGKTRVSPVDIAYKHFGGAKDSSIMRSQWTNTDRMGHRWKAAGIAAGYGVATAVRLSFGVAFGFGAVVYDIHQKRKGRTATAIKHMHNAIWFGEFAENYQGGSKFKFLLPSWLQPGSVTKSWKQGDIDAEKGYTRTALTDMFGNIFKEVSRSESKGNTNQRERENVKFVLDPDKVSGGKLKGKGWKGIVPHRQTKIIPFLVDLIKAHASTGLKMNKDERKEFIETAIKGAFESRDLKLNDVDVESMNDYCTAITEKVDKILPSDFKLEHDKEAAATKIQSLFRGVQVRRPDVAAAAQVGVEAKGDAAVAKIKALIAQAENFKSLAEDQGVDKKKILGESIEKIKQEFTLDIQDLLDLAIVECKPENEAKGDDRNDDKVLDAVLGELNKALEAAKAEVTAAEAAVAVEAAAAEAQADPARGGGGEAKGEAAAEAAVAAAREQFADAVADDETKGETKGETIRAGGRDDAEAVQEEIHKIDERINKIFPPVVVEAKGGEGRPAPDAQEKIRLKLKYINKYKSGGREKLLPLLQKHQAEERGRQADDHNLEALSQAGGSMLDQQLDRLAQELGLEGEFIAIDLLTDDQAQDISDNVDGFWDQNEADVNIRQYQLGNLAGQAGQALGSAMGHAQGQQQQQPNPKHDREQGERGNRSSSSLTFTPT